jgi:hypothetical protein
VTLGASQSSGGETLPLPHPEDELHPTAKAFHFPFVLITQSPGTPAAFRVYGPDRLKTILARLDISSLRWERIEEL